MTLGQPTLFNTYYSNKAYFLQKPKPMALYYRPLLTLVKAVRPWLKPYVRASAGLALNR